MLLCKRFKALLLRISGGEMKGSNRQQQTGTGRAIKRRRRKKENKSALFSESKVI